MGDSRAVSIITGQVHRSGGSVYDVGVDGSLMRCRIKGKTLAVEERVHAPIAVGDFLEIEPDPYEDAAGWILNRLERTTQIDRWSRKHRAMQVLAANVDQVACVTAPRSPPFRPRFIDRLLVSRRACRRRVPDHSQQGRPGHSRAGG